MSRLTLAYVAQVAESKGFTVERCGRCYELFSNDKAPGVVGVYDSLEQAWGDVEQLLKGINPLCRTIPI